MRPIKFRVWDIKNKKFIYEYDACHKRLAISFDGKVYHGGYDDVLSTSDYIVQQYTGLNDYKGKEIYEGDILDIFNHPQPEEVIYCSSETAFGFFAHEDKERQNGRFESLGDYTSPSGYTVIGNIFENPELLDKTKEL